MKTILLLGIALICGVFADSKTYEAQVPNGAAISVTNNLGSIQVTSTSGSTVRFLVDSSGSFDNINIAYTESSSKYSLVIDSLDVGSAPRGVTGWFTTILASFLVLSIGNVRPSIIFSILFLGTLIAIQAQSYETVNVIIQVPTDLQLSDLDLSATVGTVDCPLSIPICLAASCYNLTKLAFAAVPDGYCTHTFASGLNKPRALLYISNNTLLVLESGSNSITTLWDDDHNGISDSNERITIATASGLNHALYYHDNYLYASSPSTVYRWPYTPGQRSKLVNMETIVTGIPTGGHSSRSLVIDSFDRLYVQVGSAGNVDPNPSRAGILRFNLTGETHSFSSESECIQGLRMDQSGVLWGVENGVDDLSRDPWGDIHNDNPAEELNSFGNLMNVESNRFYGYPYCFSEYNITVAPYGGGPGTQWSHSNFMNGMYNDNWCKNSSNVVRPALAMPAHVAPLDIIFYYGSDLPGIASGDAFVSWHGSWNRSPPQGYKVVHVKFDKGVPVSWEPFFEYDQGSDKGTSWPHRPVGLAIGGCTSVDKPCVFISSDATGIIAQVVPKN